MNHFAIDNQIIRCEVGSGAHGIAIEGQDDTDLMAVCIEPSEYVIGISGWSETYNYRTAEERLKHNRDSDQRYHGRTPPSEPGDTDLVIHGLRKYARLAAKGNPSILVLLQAKPVYDTYEGRSLQRNAGLFASKQAGSQFLGYLKAQRERLEGKRGQMRVTRTELVEKYGFDTKYASHAVRLGIQGIQYLLEGSFPVPMRNHDRDLVLRIKEGGYSFYDTIQWIETLEWELKRAIDVSPLPKKPDYNRINEFLLDTYHGWWDAQEERLEVNR